MTTQLTPVPQAQIDELARLYTFTNTAEIIAFLEQYPDLMPLLVEAQAVVAEEFPQNTTELEFEIDPEIPAYDHINITIVTPLLDGDSRMAWQRFVMGRGDTIIRRSHMHIWFSVLTPEEYAEE